jgi:hypothetical protein
MALDASPDPREMPENLGAPPIVISRPAYSSS